MKENNGGFGKDAVADEMNPSFFSFLPDKEGAAIIRRYKDSKPSSYSGQT